MILPLKRLSDASVPGAASYLLQELSCTKFMRFSRSQKKRWKILQLLGILRLCGDGARNKREIIITVNLSAMRPLFACYATVKLFGPILWLPV
jgi:hypothetical protein